MKKETCAICGCNLHRIPNTYANPTAEGRSHATKHHNIPERFFGRSLNRKNTQRPPIFSESPWGQESSTCTLCYDCHEEMLHNPVILPEDIDRLATIIRAKGLSEDTKSDSKDKLAARIMLLQDIIHKGIDAVSNQD